MKNILLILFIITSFIYAQNRSVSGVILNDENGEGIPYVNIRISGTTQGTSSNFEGKFILNLPADKNKLVFTAVGFKKNEIIISDDATTNIKIKLKPEPIRMMEIVVGATEDPAYRIIREAIKRKKENYAGLNSLEYEFFSKNILLSGGNVASVAEKFSSGFYRRDKREKIIIHSIHATENEKKNLARFNQNIIEKVYVNFSADSMMIISNKVFLPLADNAFDYYDYKLTEVKQHENIHDCSIEVIPRSDIQPLLEGKIVIEDSSYSIKNVDLKINKGVRFPFVNDLKIQFSQSLDKFDKYWLPISMKVETSLKVNFSGMIGLDVIEMNDHYIFNKYKINPEIADSIYDVNTALASDTSAVKKRKSRAVAEITREQMESLRPVPLTTNEIKAYKELDSSKTIATQLKFSGVFAGMAERAVQQNQQKQSGTGVLGYAAKVFNYVDFSDNRVNGIFLGAKYNQNLFDKTAKVDMSLGYSFGRKKPEGNIRLLLYPKEFFLNEIELDVYNKTTQGQLLNPYPFLINSASVALGFEDQFDYYLARGISLGFRSRILHDLTLKTEYIYEDQFSLIEYDYKSIFNSSRFVRPNPEIVEGKESRLSFNLLAGKNPQEFQPILEDGILMQLDISNPVIGSDFNYKRFRFVWQLTTKTFYGELFSSPFLAFGFEGGFTIGDYGNQHFITPNTALAFYSPFLSYKGLSPYEITGDKMIGVHLEHNWKTIVFQALGINFLSDLFIDINTGASILQMWNESKYYNQPKEKFYWEGYIGLGKILGIGRIDFCYNSNKNFVVRAGLSALF